MANAKLLTCAGAEASAYGKGDPHLPVSFVGEPKPYTHVQSVCPVCAERTARREKARALEGLRQRVRAFSELLRDVNPIPEPESIVLAEEAAQ